MIRTLSSLLVLSALAMPAIAQDSAPANTNVATVAKVIGSVQVNQGERFVPLRAGMALKAGDRVMALSKGSATLRFSEGCDVNVAPETMLVVPKACGAAVAVQSTAPSGSGAVGSTGAAAGQTASPTLILASGVVGMGALYAQEDQNNTASP